MRPGWLSDVVILDRCTGIGARWAGRYNPEASQAKFMRNVRCATLRHDDVGVKVENTALGEA